MPVYLSTKGLEKLKAELEDRTKKKRREIAEHISVAKDLGDLSENFEYHEAKEQQALNEARVAQLQQMIHDVVIVEDATGGDDITIGTTFIAEVAGKEKTFTIVGSTEADPMNGKISNESPTGMAFLGRRVGERVEVETQSGTIFYDVKEIK